MNPTPPTMLRTGAEFKKSLDDGRAVWVGGKRLEKVTDNPALGAGIDLMSEMFDDQFSDEWSSTTTMRDEATDTIVSRSWQVPTTIEDLQERRKLIEYTTMKTVGTYGRPPDLGPLIALGLLAHVPSFKRSKSAFAANNPDFADNIEQYFRNGRAKGLVAAEVLADPQNDRSKGSGNTSGLLRVVSQEKGGVRVSGAKSVGSLAAQADEILFTNLLRPDFPAEACIWAALPCATEGLKMVAREPVSNPGAHPFDHPLGCRGEEADQFIIFDKVFIPNERIFNLGDPSLLKYYGPVACWAHWHVLTRLAVKAELFVGTAQLIIEALGTQKIPGVRSYMADLIEYAQALRAFIVAAEHRPHMTEGGVLSPNVDFLTAGRLYSINNYPRIIHTIQELCGQGLVMRFTRADFDSPDVGHYLDDLLPGCGVSAQTKNRLMNFVWDLTSSSLAGRVELFENVNSTPAPFLRERLFNEFGRDDLVAKVRGLAGI
jgi:4-hydroxyphenylacetate 3-monooxygenase